jgi:hypothetical protein
VDTRSGVARRERVAAESISISNPGDASEQTGA